MTRARGTGLVLVAVLFASTALAPLALASGDQASYRDQFNKVSYAGDDGSLSWANPWTEIGDNTNNPSAGAVQVVTGSPSCASGGCLRARGGPLPVDPIGAARYADTSLFSDAKLSFFLRAVSLELPAVPLQGVAEVQVIKQGGSWTTVQSWDMVDLTGEGLTKTVSINGFLSEGFGVRFLVVGLLGGEMFVDNVEIKGTLTPAPTTTTTINPTETTIKPSTTSTSTPPQATGGGEETSPPRDTPETTTTTSSQPTSTTNPRTTETIETTENVAAVTSDDAGPPPGTGGLRHAQHGIQASYDQGMVGDPDMNRSEVLGLTIDYRMAVEAISSAWMGLVGLILVITAALVTGHDRHTPDEPRRSRLIRP